MRGLMRLLMMFGPMIFRQFQKYQRNKARQQPTQYPDRQIERGRPSNRHDNRNDPRQAKHDRGEHVEYKDLNAELGRRKEASLSAEEKDFKLKEDEIMLDKADLRHLEGDIAKAEVSDSALEEMDDDAPRPPKKPNKDDLDLKDLFLDS